MHAPRGGAGLSTSPRPSRRRAEERSCKDFKFGYDLSADIKSKIEAVAKNVYKAKRGKFSSKPRKKSSSTPSKVSVIADLHGQDAIFFLPRPQLEGRAEWIHVTDRRRSPERGCRIPRALAGAFPTIRVSDSAGVLRDLRRHGVGTNLGFELERT